MVASLAGGQRNDCRANRRGALRGRSNAQSNPSEYVLVRRVTFRIRQKRSQKDESRFLAQARQLGLAFRFDTGRST